MQRGFCVWLVSGLLLGLAMSPPAQSSVVGPPGYIVGQVPFPGTVQGDVAVIGTAVFTGQGTFGPGTESLVRRDWDGTVTTVMNGLNSIGGLAGNHQYLFVTDNGGEQAGAATGDTVFVVSNPTSVSAPINAVGAEIAPPGSIPYAQGIALDAAGRPYVGDPAGDNVGKVWRYRLFGWPPFEQLQSGYDYIAGLAFDPSGRLFFGEVNAVTFEGRVYVFNPVTNTVSLLATGLSGAYDQVFDHRGKLLVSGGFTPSFSSSTIVEIDSAGNATQFAEGFAFSTGLDVDPISGRVYVVDFGASALTTFTPVERLFPGGGVVASDCWSEFSDVLPLLNKKGKPTSKVVCTDGDTCDRDGAENGSCLFAVGLCLRVPRTGCTPPTLTSLEITQPGQPTPDASVVQLQTWAQGALAGTSPECVGPVPVQVPLISTSKGLRPAQKKLRVRTYGSSGRPDVDRLTLRCTP
jgi:hypothetical protein